jgi:hypothetical protein
MFSRVQTVPNVDISGSGFTINSVVAGNSILVHIRWYGTSPGIATLVCPGETIELVGSVYTLTSPLSAGDHQNHRWAMIKNVQSSGNKTISGTFQAGTASSNTLALEIDAATDLDTDQGAVDAVGSANPSVAFTTTEDNDFAVALCSTLGSDPTAGTGYTHIPLNNAALVDAAEYDEDVGVAGAKTAAMVSSSGKWIITVAALKALSVGGGAIPGSVSGAQPLMSVVCG